MEYSANSTFYASAAQQIGSRNIQVSGGYEILRPLSHGTQASVFECVSESGRICILRIAARTSATEARFYGVLEAGLIRHFVKPLDRVFVTINGISSGGLVMEHGGESLRARLRGEVKLGVSVAVPVHEQIREGIQEIERFGYYHTDIGPSNILLNERGEVRICDAGNAMPTAEFSANHYRNNRRYGAPPSYKKNPDLFSAALTLYEMVAGEHLIAQYRADSDFESLKAETSRRKLTFYEHGELSAVYRRKIEALGADVASRIFELLNH